MKLEGAFRRGTFTVYGATAEILSVLETSSTWRAASNNVIAMEKVVAALDTTTPAEERVEPSVAIIKQLKLQRRLARWIPWYHDLPTHEFAGEFHHAYRDHTIHSLQAFLLGLYLFETVGSLREALETRLGAAASTSAETLETFVEWWAITSLWHDMAYPFEASHFITDVGLQQKILSNLARLLNERAYIDALGPDNSFTAKQRRDAYRLGSHIAFEFESTGDLFGNRGDRLITDLWRRLGANPEIASIAQEIERATTTSSASRPPYHDHGLMGGLVLGFLYDEAERFLTKLVETPKAERNVLPESVWLRAEAGWGDFVDHGKLVDLAIEAIAFHNINWREFNRSAIKSMWPEEGPFPAVRLDSEAHLFFMAVVDTLQDWDRHHFAPHSQESKYRPSVPSKNMLLQGVGGKLRVDIRNLPDSVTRVKNLFTDWLNASDISSLFEGGPGFSLPASVAVADYVTVNSAEASHKERERLVGLIAARTNECRRLLIDGAPNAIARTSRVFTSIHRQVDEAKKMLTRTDQDAVEQALSGSGLADLEVLAHSMVREGREISHGTINYRIGGGGFGAVYHVGSDDGPQRGYRPLAFKLYHQDALANAEKRRLFRRGYQAMRALQDHPNVVDVVDYSEVPLGFYMAFIDGSDLEAGRSRLHSVFEQLRIATEIAETVADAHERNIHHRDIKPGNVLLTQRGAKLVPILTDFDLAWIEGQTQDTVQAFANMHYGAPEQFAERLAHYRRAPTVDVYALGALTYYLMLGQAPPPNGSWKDSDWEVFQQRLVDQLPAVAVRKLMELLQRMTQYDPRHRIGEVEHVVRVMNAILAAAMSDEQVISVEAFYEQIVYKLTDGDLAPSNGDVMSPSGNLRWRIAINRNRTQINIVASLELLGDPRFENVNHEEFRTRAKKLIDGRLQDFQREYPDSRTHRVGALSKSKATELRIDGVPCTLVAANAVGRLLSAIGRAIQ